jgi:small subunit ribosomal protein S18
MAFNKKGGRRRRKKVCAFCADKSTSIDYKECKQIKKVHY